MAASSGKRSHQSTTALSRDLGDGTSGKKHLHASEQDSAEGGRRREQWRTETVGIDPERFVFLDECGVTTDMTRLYGRAPRGQRIHEGTPDGRWHSITILGAVDGKRL